MNRRRFNPWANCRAHVLLICECWGCMTNRGERPNDETESLAAQLAEESDRRIDPDRVADLQAEWIKATLPRQIEIGDEIGAMMHGLRVYRDNTTESL